MAGIAIANLFLSACLQEVSRAPDDAELTEPQDAGFQADADAVVDLPSRDVGSLSP